MDDRDSGQGRQGSVLEVAFQRLESFLDAGTPQIERTRHRAGPCAHHVRGRCRRAARVGSRIAEPSVGTRFRHHRVDKFLDGYPHADGSGSQAGNPAVALEGNDSTLPTAGTASSTVADRPAPIGICGRGRFVGPVRAEIGQEGHAGLDPLQGLIEGRCGELTTFQRRSQRLDLGTNVRQEPFSLLPRGPDPLLALLACPSSLLIGEPEGFDGSSISVASIGQGVGGGPFGLPDLRKRRLEVALGVGQP